MRISWFRHFCAIKRKHQFVSMIKLFGFLQSRTWCRTYMKFMNTMNGIEHITKANIVYASLPQANNKIFHNFLHCKRIRKKFTCRMYRFNVYSIYCFELTSRAQTHTYTRGIPFVGCSTNSLIHTISLLTLLFCYFAHIYTQYSQNATISFTTAFCLFHQTI